MAEAVHDAARRLDVDDALRAWLLSLDASTVHRLLGRRAGTETRFRHDRHNQLAYEVVVVDETSMMSLPLMARLLEAVRPDARLVLIGDQEQLASVEAGAVLGDIVGPAAFAGGFGATRAGAERGGGQRGGGQRGGGRRGGRPAGWSRRGGASAVAARAVEAGPVEGSPIGELYNRVAGELSVPRPPGGAGAGCAQRGRRCRAGHTVGPSGRHWRQYRPLARRRRSHGRAKPASNPSGLPSSRHIGPWSKPRPRAMDRPPSTPWDGCASSVRIATGRPAPLPGTPAPSNGWPTSGKARHPREAGTWADLSS